uniref:TCTP domain-containing protein n=1 Tax=Terrapene triunguis TaxID=2587831 RepID=A0A674I9F9_9SAUR
MIIYRDCISQDEMFSDIYSIREVADRLCLEVEGKMVTRTEGQIADALIGGNADPTDITGVDIVMNHHLQETSFTKESYKKYIKDYMKAIKARLEEHKPDRVKPFMTGAAEQVKHIIYFSMHLIKRLHYSTCIVKVQITNLDFFLLQKCAQRQNNAKLQRLQVHSVLLFVQPIAKTNKFVCIYKR